MRFILLLALAGCGFAADLAEPPAVRCAEAQEAYEALGRSFGAGVLTVAACMG